MLPRTPSPQPSLPILLTSCGKLRAMAAAGDRRQVLVDLLKVHLEVSLGRGASQGFRRCLRGGATSLRAQVLLPSRGTEKQ